MMDVTLLTDALRRYVRRNDKNLNILMNMAKTFRVEQPLHRYMEVLL